MVIRLLVVWAWEKAEVTPASGKGWMVDGVAGCQHLVRLDGDDPQKGARGGEESAEAVEIILRIASSLFFRSQGHPKRGAAQIRSSDENAPMPLSQACAFSPLEVFRSLDPANPFSKAKGGEKTGLTGSSSSGPCHTAACPRLCWLPARARQGWAVHQPSSSSGDVGGGATTTCLQGWRAVWACVCGR